MTTATKPLPTVPMPQGTESKTEMDIPSRKHPVKKQKPVDNLDQDEFEFFHEFSRSNVKGVIHLITAELKDRGTDVEYLMIPLRPEQTNEKLLGFLNQVFPLGNGQPVNEKKQLKIISKCDVWTLFQALKYIWCRLPGAEVVGWKAYNEFKLREKDKDYPRKSFLEIMPQCLASPNHASIVYDFFDLIVTISSNSKVNKMSARKISKMCAVWAFGKFPDQNHDYDFDSKSSKTVNNSIKDGFDQWIPGSDAMFHLLLAFLRSFVPKDIENAKLPKTLKNLLFNSEYPPLKSTAFASETILTIPLVTLHTSTFSRKPWQLLERCNEMLNFDHHDAFEAREDYALLKSLFKKKNNVEGISRKMSQESRRLMKEMSTKHSTFQAGWAPRKALPNDLNLRSKIDVKRIDIDDYFIWTWLSTLSYEQTSEKKKIFGRSLILEFEFDGFKKWVVFQESDLVLEHIIDEERQKSMKAKKDSINTSFESDTFSEPTSQSSTNRNITPVYEKFQNEVPQNSVAMNPKSTNTSGYHTVIDLDARKDKNNMKNKIQKWNPLHNLRKKSGNSETEHKEATSDIKKKFKSHKYDDSAPLTDLSDPMSYQLPDIKPDDKGFSIELPDIEGDQLLDDKRTNNHGYITPVSNSELNNQQAHAYQRPAQPNKFNIRQRPSRPDLRANNDDIKPIHEDRAPEKEEKRPSKEQRIIPKEEKRITDGTIEDLSGMVEQMMAFEYQDADAIENSDDILKGVTKFDQYKRNEIQSTDSLAVHSLKISTGTSESLVDSLDLPNTKKGLEPQLVNHERSPYSRVPVSMSNDIDRTPRLVKNKNSSPMNSNDYLSPTNDSKTPMTRRSPDLSYQQPDNNSNYPQESVQEANRYPNPSTYTNDQGSRHSPVGQSKRNISPERTNQALPSTPRGPQTKIPYNKNDILSPSRDQYEVSKAIPQPPLQEHSVNHQMIPNPQMVPNPQMIPTPKKMSNNRHPQQNHQFNSALPNQAYRSQSPEKKSMSPQPPMKSNIPIPIPKPHHGGIVSSPSFQDAMPTQIPPPIGNKIYSGSPMSSAENVARKHLNVPGSQERLPQQQPFHTPQKKMGYPNNQSDYASPQQDPYMEQQHGGYPPQRLQQQQYPQQQQYQQNMYPPQGYSDNSGYGQMMPPPPAQDGYYPQYNNKRMPNSPSQYGQFMPVPQQPQPMAGGYRNGNGAGNPQMMMPNPQYSQPLMPPHSPHKRQSNFGAGAGAPADYIPPMVPMAPMGHVNKLHGVNMNKKREQKKLYNDIRSGNFGI